MGDFYGYDSLYKTDLRRLLGISFVSTLGAALGVQHMAFVTLFFVLVP